jgi:flagellar hook-associated protein 1 FlgK
MSLSGALSNAVSGLAVQAKSASLVSSNISNALTEGYGRRQLNVASDSVSTHGGVRVLGVVRHADAVLIADKRLADGHSAGATLLSQHADRMETLIGGALDGDSLTGRLDSLEASLIAASSDPSSTQRLRNIAQAAQSLAGKLNGISDGVQASRRSAETSITDQVQQLNTSLTRISDINVRISRSVHAGADVSTLEDQRQTEIDRVAQIIPLRAIPRDKNTVALYSMGGTLLLDGKPPEFEFQRSNEIAPHMTLGNGLLSDLTIDGRSLNAGPDGMIAGGTLSALFEIRDIVAPDLQTKLDGVAFDLGSRLGPGGPDATLVTGDSGVFTDLGVPIEPVNEIGLAGRITLNSDLDPSGSSLWRLRDGLGSVAPGNPGDASLINGWRNALVDPVSTSSSSLRPEPVAISTHFAELSSYVTDQRIDAEQTNQYLSDRLLAAEERYLSDSVDTDTELQDLIKIEQNYAANAQVIRVVDDLMQLLFR